MANYTGNISTIVKWLSMIIAGKVIGTLAAHGLNLGVDATTLSECIGAIIFLGIGYIDARFPNTFKFLGLNNDLPVAETVIGDDTDDI